LPIDEESGGGEESKLVELEDIEMTSNVDELLLGEQRSVSL